MSRKFAVKIEVPTLFLAIAEDDCGFGWFPSESEAVSNAAPLEE